MSRGCMMPDKPRRKCLQAAFFSPSVFTFLILGSVTDATTYAVTLAEEYDKRKKDSAVKFVIAQKCSATELVGQCNECRN